MINGRLIVGASKRLFRLLWGEVQTETDRISRSASQVEGKIKSNKGADPKGLLVTHWIMSVSRKYKNRDMKHLGGPKGHTMAGSPSGLLF